MSSGEKKLRSNKKLSFRKKRRKNHIGANDRTPVPPEMKDEILILWFQPTSNDTVVVVETLSPFFFSNLLVGGGDPAPSEIRFTIATE